jgi:hypothetical protein
MNEEIYDFYFSRKHWNHLKQMAKMTAEDKPVRKFIGGIEYTEYISKGKTPHTAHFGDLKKVHAGKDKGFTSKPY